MYNEKVVYIDKNNYEIYEEIPNNANCETYFSVDPLIAEGISILNKKGYETLICCQGHVPRMSCGSLLENIQEGYVAFSEDVVLPNIPDCFYPMMLSVGKYNNCIVSDIEMVYHSHLFTESEFQERIIKQSTSLNNWAKQLPELKKEPESKAM